MGVSFFHDPSYYRVVQSSKYELSHVVFARSVSQMHGCMSLMHEVHLRSQKLCSK